MGYRLDHFGCRKKKKPQMLIGVWTDDGGKVSTKGMALVVREHRLKATLDEGHGFSRATQRTETDEGFSP
jgi:hypothetical protein